MIAIALGSMVGMMFNYFNSKKLLDNNANIN